MGMVWFLTTSMFKVLSWNVRGSSLGVRSLDQPSLKMDILIICEPKVPFSKAKGFLRRYGFPNAEIMEPSGFSGGMIDLGY